MKAFVLEGASTLELLALVKGARMPSTAEEDSAEIRSAVLTDAVLRRWGLERRSVIVAMLLRGREPQKR
jgi:hypothetical protein